ncbi:chloramphenicol phosphotransferase [bacterium]|nr:chloramphenicol phosphotransferase [bacterium]
MILQKIHHYIFIIIMIFNHYDFYPYETAILGNIMKNDWQVIYINGGSSVGKTTFIRSLQNTLETPWMYVGIDLVITMMPAKYNDWTGKTLTEGFSWKTVKETDGNILYQIHMGPIGKDIINLLKKTAVFLLQAGYKIIIDDVSFGKQEVDLWRETLKEYKVIWVGLHAPIEVIEEREKNRGDRMPGSAKLQALQVHTDVSYDIMLNTHTHTVQENINLLKNYMNIKKN